MTRIVPTLVLILTLSKAIAQQPDESPIWTVTDYQFPAERLTSGFTSPDRGWIKAPPLPPETASPEQLREFIRKSTSVVANYLESKGLPLPKGALFAFDPESLTLAARLPEIAHSSIEFTAAEIHEVPVLLCFDMQIIEAASDVVRGVMLESSRMSDHSALLDRLTDLAEGGQATIVSSGHIETPSGQLAKLRQTERIAYPELISVEGRELVEFELEDLEIGTSWEIEPVLGRHGRSINFTVELNHHFAPVRRRQQMVTSTPEEMVSVSVPDTYSATLKTMATLAAGSSKLLGVWTPEGLEEARIETLQAAFVTADVVPILPLPNDRVTQILRQQGEAVLPVPKGRLQFELAGEEIPPGMLVRRFRVPPSILENFGSDRGAADDPFADLGDREPTFTIQATARDILKAAGVSFPPGASANYLSRSSEIVLRNTPQNMQMVETYVTSLREETTDAVSITCHLVQAPGPVLRKTAAEARAWANHQPAWESLLEQEETTVLCSYRIEALVGILAQLQSGRNFLRLPAVYSGQHSASTATSAKGKADVVRALASAVAGDRRPKIEVLFEDSTCVGTEIAVEPIIAADGVTVNISANITHDYAPPVVGGGTTANDAGDIVVEAPAPSFREASVSTAATMRSGAIRMLGMWRPKGTAAYDQADILQAAFVRTVVVR